MNVPAFGDRVRIRPTPETNEAGIAGLEGDIYGMTTPSVTKIEAIGGAPDDRALNVSIGERGATYWVRPDLVELVHHNEGMVMKVGRVTAVRTPDGTWTETIEPRSLWQRLKGIFRA